MRYVPLIIIVIVLMFSSSYAYYIEDHKLYVDFPSEPRIQAYEFTEEGTTVETTAYQSVDETGIYNLALSTITPPAKDDTWKEGFLEDTLLTAVGLGNGQLIHKNLKKTPHYLMQYVYNTMVRDTLFTVAGVASFKDDGIVLDISTMFPTEEVDKGMQNYLDFTGSLRLEE